MVESQGVIDGARQLLEKLPRVSLASLPTPLQECLRLERELGGPRIFVKRDDLTGLAFGGNKVRQHEFVLGAALADGADCFVQGASSQSNHSRQLAAAGAKLGIETFLLPKKDSHSFPVQGNYLVDHLLGARISPIGVTDSSVRAKNALTETLRSQGRHPYVTGMGADESLALAAVAYFDAGMELMSQMPEGIVPHAIYTASQGSTQGGLMLACEMLKLPTKVVGISPLGIDHEAHIPLPEIVRLIHRAAEIIGIDTAISEKDIELRFEFVGEGYGRPTPASIESIAHLGRAEAILLDPVYTGKAFSGLLADVRTGRYGDDDVVVFLHTGGLPALFAYAEELYESLSQAHEDSSEHEVHQREKTNKE